MRRSFLTSSAKVLANVAVVLGLLLQAHLCWLKFQSTGAFNWLGLVAVNAVMVTLYVARSEATAISRSPGIWLLALAGTCLPLAMRPAAPGPWSEAGTVVQLAGTLAVLLSLLSLRRSFGIVPAHRGLKTAGLYRYVRHPLYASELLLLCGMVLVGPSAANALLLMAAFILQYARATTEERFLSQDPAYLAYQSRVRYRLIPRLI